MVTIAIAIIIVGSVAVVAWPLFNRSNAAEDLLAATADPGMERLVVQRDAAYAAIKELEFDYSTGKLSEADFKSLRAKTETKAVAILQELDALTAAQAKPAPASSREEMIERQVRRLRDSHSAAGGARCPGCGTPHPADAAFCAKCGAPLRGTRCRTCGTRAALGDKFCARCGSRITTTA